MSTAQTVIRDMTRGDLDAVLPLLDQLGYDVPREELATRFEAVSGSDGAAAAATEPVWGRRRGRIADVLPSLQPGQIMPGIAFAREVRHEDSP